MDPSDRQRFELFRHHGDQAAFASLVTQYLPLVHAVALRITSNPTQTQDISQAVFVKLAGRPVSALVQAPLSVWLHGETRTQALGFLRGEQRRRRREHLAASLHVAMSSSESSIPWERISPLIDEVISQLPPKEQEIILARFFEGRSHRHIATALGLSEDASRMRVNRGLEKLRTLLARRGITATTTALASALSGHALSSSVPIGLSASIAAVAGTTVLIPPTFLTLLIMTLSKKTTAAFVGLLILASMTGLAVHHSNDNNDSPTYPRRRSSDSETDAIFSPTSYDASRSKKASLRHEPSSASGGWDWDEINARNATYARAEARSRFEKRFAELASKLSLSEAQQATLRSRVEARLDAFDGEVPVGDFGIFSGRTLAGMLEVIGKEKSVDPDLPLADILKGEQIQKYQELRAMEITNEAEASALIAFSEILATSADAPGDEARTAIRKILIEDSRKEATDGYGGVRAAVVEAAGIIHQEKGDLPIESLDRAASLAAVQQAAHRQIDEKVAALQPYLSPEALQAYRTSVEHCYSMPNLDEEKP